MAALALVFAINSFRPAPFFVLDEVDAALDNVNVARVASYVRRHSDDVQYIIISLKGAFYERGNSLVGIYRDQEVNSSKTATLDVSIFHLHATCFQELTNIVTVDRVRRLKSSYTALPNYFTFFHQLQ